MLNISKTLLIFFLFSFSFRLPSRGAVTSHLSDSPKSVEIESLWANGQKSQANDLLEKWMKEEKKSPWPWVQAAVMGFRQNKINRSLSYLNKALENYPQCADAYYWRGRNFESQKKYLEAANEFRAVLVIETEHIEAQEALARVLVLLEK